MFGICDERALFLGVTAPEHEDDGSFALVEQRDDKVGKALPAPARMRTAHAGAHGEHGVEQQNALFRPTGKIAACSGRNAQVELQRFVNVDQRRRALDALSHGKTHAVCLAFADVRVLPDDDHLDVFVRGVGKGGENILFGRINGVRGIFRAQKFAQFVKVFAVELSAQQLVPAVSQM